MFCSGVKYFTLTLSCYARVCQCLADFLGKVIFCIGGGEGW